MLYRNNIMETALVSGLINSNKIWANFFEYRRLSCFLCSAIGCLYCAGLTFTGPFWQNVLTVLFTVSLIALLVFNVRKMSEVKNPLSLVLIQVLLLNSSIALTALVLNSPSGFFWIQDAMTAHLPQSFKFANFFKGNFSNLRDFFQIESHQGVTTHAVTGLFIAVFGGNPFATIMAQVIFKLITVYLIFHVGKVLWSERVGFIATQFYALCPTIFFYNLVLYKEGAVQALLALVLLSSLQLFVRKRYWFILPLLAGFGLLAKERFYIAYLLLTATLPLAVNVLPRSRSRKLITVFGVLVALLVVFYYFREPILWKVDFYIQSLSSIRDQYASYADVMNKYNYDIPYPVAFIKILFSPYFTPNKFVIFNDFSLLLIWGSFFNQIVIFSAIFGFVHSLRSKFFHLYLWLPFIIFLIFAAYISPFSGRLRDSFYPLIACYAAFYLSQNKYAQKLLGKGTDEVGKGRA